VPPALRIVLSLVALVASGTLLLMLPLAGGSRPLRWNEALFTATAALGVTGLVTITPATELSRFGYVVLLLLIQLGGVGFMVGAVVVLRILGRRIGLTDRIALSDSLGLLSPAAIISLSSKVLITVLVIEPWARRCSSSTGAPTRASARARRSSSPSFTPSPPSATPASSCSRERRATRRGARGTTSAWPLWAR
jgi:hypothetical protein